MTLDWIKGQVEAAQQAKDAPENVFYLAMLLIVQSHLQAVASDSRVAQRDEEESRLWERILRE